MFRRRQPPCRILLDLSDFARPKMTKAEKKRPVLERRHRDFGVRAGYLVHDVSRLRRAFFDEQMKPYGLTRSQWWVLGQLSRHQDRSMSQVELAKHLDVGKAALGGLIDRLETARYVRRDSVPGDRRVNLITITPKGFEVVSAMRKIGHALNARIFGGLTDAEVAVLEDMLSRVKRNLIELVDVEQEPPARRSARTNGVVQSKAAARNNNTRSRMRGAEHRA
jgi:MarR family transcriptional regulator, transcriptional regulator for hemolysin